LGEELMIDLIQNGTETEEVSSNGEPKDHASAST
jgi:hypothetical protein